MEEVLSMGPTATLLLLADRRQSHTHKTLRSAGYHVILSFTPDHAVAFCVNNKVDAVVLDQGHFVVTEGWSVAQSIKMIRHRICVILMIHGKIVSKELPVGVDAMIPEGDTQTLLKTIKQLL
jgi:DNA-binding NtrC family response regulator